MNTLFDIKKIDMEELVRTIITRAKEENRPQGDILKEEIMKIAHGTTDQSKSHEHNKISDNIIPHDCNIEHGQVYKEATGKVVKDLYEGRE